MPFLPKMPFHEYKKLSWKYSETFISDVQFREYHAFRKRREREELLCVKKQLEDFMNDEKLADVNPGYKKWSLDIEEHDDSTILNIGGLAYLLFVYNEIGWADTIALVPWDATWPLKRINRSDLSYIYDFRNHKILRYQVILSIVDKIEYLTRLYEESPFRYGKFYAHVLEKYGYKTTVGRTRLTIEYSEYDRPLELQYIGRNRFCTPSDKRLHLVFSTKNLIEMMELVDKIRAMSRENQYMHDDFTLYRRGGGPSERRASEWVKRYRGNREEDRRKKE